jgi:hypothetical protein
MTETDDTARLRDLCERASKEYDGEKLIELVRNINELLDKIMDKKPRAQPPTEKKECSGRVGACTVTSLARFFGGRLGKKLRERPLPLFECIQHPAGNEKPVRQVAQHTEADVVVHGIAYHCAVDALARLPRKLMPVMPTLEWPLLLHVGKVMVPFKLRDA